jgi:hypothetical protein
VRTCVATRRKAESDGMVRFVAGPDGEVVPDVRGRLPGRGVWVDGTRGAVELAVKRKAFAHGLKAAVTASGSLPALVERLLAEDATQALALANKAGVIIRGFAKAEAALATGRVGALLSASDAARDGIRKIAAANRSVGGPENAVPHLFSLSASEMGLALGRENAIHLAVLAGAAGEAFISRCRRLDRFRSGGVESGGPGADMLSASSGPFVLSDRQDAELDE